MTDDLARLLDIFQRYPDLVFTVVESKNIQSVAHADNTLFIRFRSKRVYRYDNVPASVYDELVTAESVGEFFSKRVRDVYAATEVK